MKYVMAISFFVLIAVAPLAAQAQGKAKVRITVIDGLGNVVEGAAVTLYGSEEDYRNSQNAIFQGTTNAKGQVKFKKMPTRAYFIDARKDDLKNDGRGAKTEVLAKGKMTKLNVIIE